MGGERQGQRPGCTGSPGVRVSRKQEQGSLRYKPALSVCWELGELRKNLLSHRVTIWLSRLHWELKLLEPADEAALIFCFDLMSLLVVTRLMARGLSDWDKMARDTGIHINKKKN